MRLGLRGFSYTGKCCPAEVRADSGRTVETHPEIVVLPTTFGVVEKTGATWDPQGSLLVSPHDARAFLYNALRELWPMIYEFDEERRERYARAAEEFRALGRANELTVDGRLFRVCRTERLVRVGPDGPEGPRPDEAASDHGRAWRDPSPGVEVTLRIRSGGSPGARGPRAAGPP
ncbi:DUF5954 family protein [Streptomyces sp. NPDC048623]|uniref:DUF5954 family protein n=1 Tax=Streptomyces sp. NPDC048623 TaxID=3155761 RepID=UPI0034319AC1